ncbi:RAD55 family ATPase [Archaeoglobus sulfaticallidus]|nr:ATPase domain-containing protein [Archaeoglobus sulfaticallidus]
MERIDTGIIGLNELLDGGFLPNSVVAVLGSSGVGKTIFSIQYLLSGVQRGDRCIYISFDLEKEDIIKQMSSLGWTEIADYIENGKIYVKSFFAENVSFVNNDLLNILVSEAGISTRIVIDSFTPMISSFNLESRNDIKWFFQRVREISTAIITVEEPLDGKIDDPSVSIPIFLSDTAIHLKNIGYGEAFSRTLKIIKHRGSWHAEGIFPYKILKGIGLFVETGDILEELVEEKIDLDEILRDHGVSRENIDPFLLRRLEILANSGQKNAKEVISNIIERVVGK